MLAAVQPDVQRHDLVGVVDRPDHRVTQLDAFRPVAQEAGQRLIGRGGARCLVDRDQRLVAMRLDGARLRDDHRRDARLVGVDEFLEKRAQVDTGTGDAEHAITRADLDVQPDLRDVQVRVVIDVDVEDFRLAQRIEKPLVARFFRVQHVARLVAGHLVVVVEIEAPAAIAAEEVRAAAQVVAIGFGFLEKERPQRGVVLAGQPLPGDFRVRQALCQRKVARDRRQDAFALQLREIARIRLAEVIAYPFENAPADQAGSGNGEQTGEDEREYRLGAKAESQGCHRWFRYF